jgi:hypothetical protein
MRIFQGLVGFYIVAPMLWRADWAWGMLLIVLSVVIHVIGLGLISQGVARAFRHMLARPHTTAGFAVVMGTLTLLVTSLHSSKRASGRPLTGFSVPRLTTRPRCSIR